MECCIIVEVVEAIKGSLIVEFFVAKTAKKPKIREKRRFRMYARSAPFLTFSWQDRDKCQEDPILGAKKSV